MGTIREVYDKVNFVKEYLPSEVDRIVNELTQEIIDLNTEGQLFLGFDNENKEIGIYKPLTQELTEGITGKGYPKNAGEPFNMYATGNLFKYIGLRVNNGRINFFYTKSHPFVQRYNKPLSLIGLNSENQETLNYELVLPKIRQWVMKTLR